MTTTRIPFSAEDHQEVAQLGTWMMAVAVIHFVIGAIALLFSGCGCIGAFAQLTQGVPGILNAVRTFLSLFAGPVLIGQGILLLQAKGHLDGVPSGDSNQPQLVADALGRVKLFFIVEIAYGLLQILMACITSASTLLMPGGGL